VLNNIDSSNIIVQEDLLDEGDIMAEEGNR
jgi:hypothetical protein